jgi:hypothetical protein
MQLNIPLELAEKNKTRLISNQISNIECYPLPKRQRPKTNELKEKVA